MEGEGENEYEYEVEVERHLVNEGQLHLILSLHLTSDVEEPGCLDRLLGPRIPAAILEGP